jgi:hypothetical protein
MTTFEDKYAAHYNSVGHTVEHAKQLCKMITEKGLPELDLAPGARGFFLGGATHDRWQVRSGDVNKYPDGVDGLFEPVSLLVLCGMSNSSDSAGAEVHSMAGANQAELAAAVNWRRGVSEHEHHNACAARPGAVYMRIAKQVSPLRD